MPTGTSNVELLNSIYQARPNSFTEEQVDTLEQLSELEGVRFSRLASSSPFNLANSLKEMGKGFVEGFTTIPVWKQKPRNIYDQIAYQIGSLAGFVGYIPGLGTASKIGTMSLFKGMRYAGILGKVSGKSVPMLVGGALTRALERTPITAAMDATKFLAKGTVKRSMVDSAIHLGFASAVSAAPIYDLTPTTFIDERMPAFGHGALFGAGNAAIGNLFNKNGIFNIGKYGTKEIAEMAKVDKTKAAQMLRDTDLPNTVARAISSGLIFGMPSTINDYPLELQVYEYLLNAYFGGKELSVNQKSALEFMKPYLKDPISRRMLIAPEILPGFNKLPEKVRNEITVQSEFEFGGGQHEAEQLFTNSYLNIGKNVMEAEELVLRDIEDGKIEGKAANDMLLMIETRKTFEQKLKDGGKPFEDMSEKEQSDVLEETTKEVRTKIAKEAFDEINMQIRKNFANDFITSLRNNIKESELTSNQREILARVDAIEELYRDGGLSNKFAEPIGDIVESYANSAGWDVRDENTRIQMLDKEYELVSELTNTLARQRMLTKDDFLTTIDSIFPTIDKYESVKNNAVKVFYKVKQASPVVERMINADGKLALVPETQANGTKRVTRFEPKPYIHKMLDQFGLDNGIGPKFFEVKEAEYLDGEKKATDKASNYMFEKLDKSVQFLENAYKDGIALYGGKKQDSNLFMGSFITTPEQAADILGIWYDVSKELGGKFHDHLPLALDRWEENGGSQEVFDHLAGNNKAFVLKFNFPNIDLNNKQQIKDAIRTILSTKKKGAFLLSPDDINKRNQLFGNRDIRLDAEELSSLVGSDKINYIILNAVNKDGSSHFGEDSSYKYKTIVDGKVVELPFDAHFDGKRKWRQDVIEAIGKIHGLGDEVHKFFGWKGAAIGNPEDGLGGFMSKHDNSPADDVLSSWMKENDIHLIEFDKTMKQIGMRKSYDWKMVDGKIELYDNGKKINIIKEREWSDYDINYDYPSFFRGQAGEPTIDENGNLVLRGSYDPLYKHIKSGVSLTDNIELAVDYAFGQREVKQNLASESYDAEELLDKIDSDGVWLIQIKDDATPDLKNIERNGEEWKKIGDLIVPKGSYRIKRLDVDEPIQTIDQTKKVSSAASNEEKTPILTDISTEDRIAVPTSEGEILRSDVSTQANDVVYRQKWDDTTLQLEDVVKDLSTLETTTPKQLTEMQDAAASKAFYENVTKIAVQKFTNDMKALGDYANNPEAWTKAVHDIMRLDLEQEVDGILDGVYTEDNEALVRELRELQGPATKILKSIGTITPEVLILPGVQPYFEKALLSYFARTISAPKTKYGAKLKFDIALNNQIATRSGLAKDEYMLGRDAKTVLIKDKDGKDTTLGKYVEENGIDGLEHLLIRVPRGDDAGAQVLKFAGFLEDQPGTYAYLHPEQYGNLGGADNDGDTLFLLTNMPKEVHDYYKKHKDDHWDVVNGQRVLTELKTSKQLTRKGLELYESDPLSSMLVNQYAYNGNLALGPGLNFSKRIRSIIYSMRNYGMNSIDVNGNESLLLNKKIIKGDLKNIETIISDIVNFAADSNGSPAIKDVTDIKLEVFKTAFPFAKTRNGVIPIDKYIKLYTRRVNKFLIEKGQDPIEGLIIPKIQAMKEMTALDSLYSGYSMEDGVRTRMDLRKFLKTMFDSELNDSDFYSHIPYYRALIDIRDSADDLSSVLNGDLYTKWRGSSTPYFIEKIQDFFSDEGVNKLLKTYLGMSPKRIIAWAQDKQHSQQYERAKKRGEDVVRTESDFTRNDLLDLVSIWNVYEKGEALSNVVGTDKARIITIRDKASKLKNEYFKAKYDKESGDNTVDDVAHLANEFYKKLRNDQERAYFSALMMSSHKPQAEGFEVHFGKDMKSLKTLEEMAKKDFGYDIKDSKIYPSNFRKRLDRLFSVLDKASPEFKESYNKFYSVAKNKFNSYYSTTTDMFWMNQNFITGKAIGDYYKLFKSFVKETHKNKEYFIDKSTGEEVTTERLVDNIAQPNPIDENTNASRVFENTPLVAKKQIDVLNKIVEDKTIIKTLAGKTVFDKETEALGNDLKRLLINNPQILANFENHVAAWSEKRLGKAITVNSFTLPEYKLFVNDLKTILEPKEKTRKFSGKYNYYVPEYLKDVLSPFDQEGSMVKRTLVFDDMNKKVYESIIKVPVSRMEEQVAVSYLATNQLDRDNQGIDIEQGSDYVMGILSSIKDEGTRKIMDEFSNVLREMELAASSEHGNAEMYYKHYRDRVEEYREKIENKMFSVEENGKRTVIKGSELIKKVMDYQYKFYKNIADNIIHNTKEYESFILNNSLDKDNNSPWIDLSILEKLRDEWNTTGKLKMYGLNVARLIYHNTIAQNNTFIAYAGERTGADGVEFPIFVEIRPSDIEDPKKRLEALKDLEALGKISAFVPEKDFDDAIIKAYHPHLGIPEHVKKAQLEKRIEEAMKTGDMLTVTKLIAAARSEGFAENSEDGGVNYDLFNLMDKLYTKGSLDDTDLNDPKVARASSLRRRSIEDASDGYDLSWKNAFKYKKQVTAEYTKLMYSLIAHYSVDRFKFESISGRNKIDRNDMRQWEMFMRTQIRQILGYPTYYPDFMMEDPSYKVQGTFFHKVTEDYWHRKLHKSGLVRKIFGVRAYSNEEKELMKANWIKAEHDRQLKFLEERAKEKGKEAPKQLPASVIDKIQSAAPEAVKALIEDEYKASVNRKLSSLSNLEGKWSMISLLSTPKSYFANRLTAETNTLISTGFEYWKKAGDLQYLKTINSNWDSWDKVEKDFDIEGGFESFIRSMAPIGAKLNVQSFRDYIEEAKLATKGKSIKEATSIAYSLAQTRGIPDWFVEKGGWFMRTSERQSRLRALIAHYLKARDALEATTFEYDWNDRWLMDMANRGVKASQFLYNASARPSFARTNLGKMATRFQMFAVNSIDFRKGIYQDAKKYGFGPTTEEYKKFERMIIADMLTFAFAAWLPSTIFSNALPAPYVQMQGIAQWLFGDEEERERAFYGALPYPTNIIQPILPPSSRVPLSIMSLAFTGDIDRFAGYQMWTFFPYGRLMNDTKRALENPHLGIERMVGIPYNTLKGKVWKPKSQTILE